MFSGCFQSLCIPASTLCPGQVNHRAGVGSSVSTTGVSATGVSGTTALSSNSSFCSRRVQDDIWGVGHALARTAPRLDGTGQAVPPRMYSAAGTPAALQAARTDGAGGWPGTDLPHPHTTRDTCEFGDWASSLSPSSENRDMGRYGGRMAGVCHRGLPAHLPGRVQRRPGEAHPTGLAGDESQSAITDSRSLPLRAGPRRVQREDHRFARVQRLAGLPPDKPFRSLSSSCHSSARTASKVMQHPRLIVSEN